MRDGADGLAARVPGCPDWSVRDLVTHVGQVHRFWAAAVAAGPSPTPPAAPAGDLLAWSQACTGLLRDALRAAGEPEQGCWAWWGSAHAPHTAGAVARHQVQEATVHAADAQQAAGRTPAVPREAALRGDRRAGCCSSCTGVFRWTPSRSRATPG